MEPLDAVISAALMNIVLVIVGSAVNHGADRVILVHHRCVTANDGPALSAAPPPLALYLLIGDTARTPPQHTVTRHVAPLHSQ